MTPFNPRHIISHSLILFHAMERNVTKARQQLQKLDNTITKARQNSFHVSRTVRALLAVKNILRCVYTTKNCSETSPLINNFRCNSNNSIGR